LVHLGWIIEAARGPRDIRTDARPGVRIRRTWDSTHERSPRTAKLGDVLLCTEAFDRREPVVVWTGARLDEDVVRVRKRARTVGAVARRRILSCAREPATGARGAIAAALAVLFGCSHARVEVACMTASRAVHITPRVARHHTCWQPEQYKCDSSSQSPAT
jgi:hypothetical protein